MKKKLIFIGGPMGVGKTAVCQHLKARLPKCVFLDGDWCWDADPFLVTEQTKAMVLDNICHLLNNFLRCPAYETVLFCWVMHRQEIMEEILNRLDTEGIQISLFSLTAEKSALKARLEKDIRAGLRDAGVIRRSLERLPLYDQLSTIIIDTTGKSVKEVSGEIYARLPDFSRA